MGRPVNDCTHCWSRPVRVVTLDCRFAADKANVRRLQFAPDGRRLAAVFGSVPHSVAVYDTASGAVMWEVPGGGAAVGEPAISPDLDSVAWAEDDGDEPFDRIRLWTRWDNRPRVLGGDPGTADVTAVAFDPTGHLLAAGVYDAREENGAARLGRALAVWPAECKSGAVPVTGYQLPFDGNESVTAIDWSGHKDRFAVGSENGAIWTGSSPDAPERLGSPIRALRHAPDGLRLLAFVGSTLAVWDFARPEWRIPLRDKPRILDVAYSPDGQILAVARRDGTVTFHDPDALAPRRTYDWKLGPLYSVAFAPDGLTCAAGATRRRVVVWDLE